MKHALWVVPLIVLVAIGGYLLLAGHAPIPPAPPTPSLPAATTPPVTATYYCSDAKTMKATFNQDSVSLTLSDGRAFELPQGIAGSGMHYEATSTRYGTDVAFIGKGDNAFLTEDGHTTYADCTAALVEASDAPGYATYTDQEKTFTFAFPTNLSVAGSAVGLSPGWAAEESTSGMLLAKLVVPRNVEPNTNFADASFTVGTSADLAAVSGCTKGPQGAVATPTKLGDMQATQLTFQGAAAGNRYDTTSYRVVHGGQCYAIEYTIHYGVLENYPKGSVKAFDEQQLVTALDEVAKSFTFLQ